MTHHHLSLGLTRGPSTIGRAPVRPRASPPSEEEATVGPRDEAGGWLGLWNADLNRTALCTGNEGPGPD